MLRRWAPAFPAVEFREGTRGYQVRVGSFAIPQGSYLLVAAVLVGFLGGFGAIAFRALITLEGTLASAFFNRRSAASSAHPTRPRAGADRPYARRLRGGGGYLGDLQRSYRRCFFRQRSHSRRFRSTLVRNDCGLERHRGGNIACLPRQSAVL